MLALVLLLQAAAARRQGATPSDSVALLERAKDARFHFVMEWRFQVQWDRFEPFLAQDREKPSDRHFVVPPTPVASPGVPTTLVSPTPTLKIFDGRCLLTPFSETVRWDLDQRDPLAHLVRTSGRPDEWACAAVSHNPAGEPTPGADRGLSIEARDSIRVLRAHLLRLFDSTARLLPGDRWIAGQRVRFALDQADVAAASRVVKECRPPPWWCGALQGYLLTAIGDRTGAARAFTTAYDAMPRDVRAEWDDATFFLLYTGRMAYAALSDTARDSANAVLWWLADPLFLEPGNDRHIEQLLRRTVLAISDGQVDLWTDWRMEYMGLVYGESLLRYGQPFGYPSCQGGMVMRGPDTYVAGFGPVSTGDGRKSSWPIPFGPHDTQGHDEGCATKVQLRFPGPTFHVTPAWHAVTDPLHTTMADWDLSPPRDVGTYWDAIWWAPEFYNRPAGPIVPVDYQIAMLRREAKPVLVAAMQWDTIGYSFPSPAKVIAGAVTMTSPTATPFGIRDTMTSPQLHGMAMTLPPGPTLLSLEMMPREGSGTAGRARFGIEAPPPLSAMRAYEFSVSDPILTRVGEGQGAPRSLQETLTRMYGTTRLRDPSRVGLFWEVYGVADHDTVSVSVTVVGLRQASMLDRISAVLGGSGAAVDSFTVRWTEPRRDDPAPTVEGGVSVRPRGIILDLSPLAADRYRIEVAVARGTQIARSHRELSIEGR